MNRAEHYPHGFSLLCTVKINSYDTFEVCIAAKFSKGKNNYLTSSPPVYRSGKILFLYQEDLFATRRAVEHSNALFNDRVAFQDVYSAPAWTRRQIRAQRNFCASS